jgi:hypothetical protein
MYIAIANAIYSSTLQGSGGGFPKACFGLDYNAITSDFTFTRNSFATRVNEFGLIETVTNLGSDLVQNGSFDELGSELVTNGDFENGDTDWTKAANWSIADGKASSNGSGGNLQQSSVLTANEVNTYLVSYDIVDYVSGGVIPNLHGTVSGTQGTAVGSYSVYITGISSANTSLFFISNNFNGSIDNVSVKQVDPNDDWSKSNSTISDGKGNLDGDGQTSLLWQDILTNGKSYKATFTISDYNGLGESRLMDNNGGAIYTITSNGTFTVYFTHSQASGNLLFRARNGAIYSVDNVVVQEVLTDDVPRIDYTGSTFDIPVLGDELVTNGSFDTDSNWSKQSGWSIANGVATFDINNYSGGNANIYQNCMVSGKEYVLTYDVVDYVQGFVRNVSRSGAIPRTANGTYTEKFIANNANLFLKADPGTNTILSIDNVSVKEVTAYTTTDKGAFLLEPISTNELIYSEDLSSWATFGSPIRTGGQDDLSGGTSAYAVEFPTANDFIRLLGVNTVGTFTASVYAKKSIGDTFYLNIAGNIGNYNFSTESFTPGTGSPTGDMIDLGNGWYRCIMTFSSTSTSSQVRIQSNSGSTVILWACQLEELPYASSYIPTSGTTVTRAQETCVDATPTINSEEGVLYAEISALVENDGIRLISLNDGTTGNIVQIYYSGSANKIICQTKVAGSTQSSLQYVASSQTDIHKVAFKYKENDFALWVDGVEIGTDLVGSVWAEGTLTELDFDIGTGSLPFYGRTKDLRVYCKALTDDELTELTTI